MGDAKIREGENKVFCKVSWFGGDKQWMSIDVICLYSHYLLKRYAYNHNFMSIPG